MCNLKRLILIALLLCCSIGDFTADAATISAKSCSVVDVKSAYDSATAGDTVAIPAGNCTWNTALGILKSITLMGAGSSNTKITRGLCTTELIGIQLPSDAPVRISGIYFDNVANINKDRIAIAVWGFTGKHVHSQIRIDNNTFNNGRRQISVAGWVYGVIDHNTFINGDIAVYVVGDSRYSWTRPIEAGTANAIFIEDNTFIVNNDAQIPPNEQIYHFDGGRSVTRYNTFDGTQYTNSTCGNGSQACTFSIFDSHGNQKLLSVGSLRGQPLLEVYNNNIRAYKTQRFFHLRGGSVLIHNNTLSVVSGTPVVFDVTDEESWQTAFFNSVKTTWPAEDQITNSFFWNNTLNGVAVKDVSPKLPSDTTFIKKDRDYFMHEPQATGGKSRYPSIAGASDMTFSSSGPNAYYPYTTYIYPHPLTGVAGTTMTPSTTVTPPPAPAPAPESTPTVTPPPAPAPAPTVTPPTTTKKRIWNR